MTGVLIDVTRLVDRFMHKRLPTGVDRVSLAYVRHYGHRARAVLRYKGGKFVFRRAESITLFEWILSLGENGSPMPIIYKGLIAGCLMQSVVGSFLFNTGHNGLESDEYVATLQRQRVRPIFMVHDLIPITHPHFCRSGEQEKHLARLRNAIHVASGIVCNSQATKDALNEHCAEQGWVAPPFVVALLAPDLPVASHSARPIEKPYFVFVSTIEPRKNHMMILRIWQKLVIQMGDAVPRLIIIGQLGWGYGEVTDLLANSSLLKDAVTQISVCTDAQMVNYFQHAQALLFPTFAEGYGMPVVEALAHNLPVIASDLPVFREFAGNIPQYVNVEDEAAWEELIRDYSIAASPLKLAQTARLAGFSSPTWADHFNLVDTFLGELAGEE